MSKVFQEFYCTISGGGCGGYFTVPLNTAINGVVEVVCPKCNHRHQRSIVNGEIKEQARFDSKPNQQIEVTIVAWSEKSRLGKMRQDHRKKSDNERDGAIITKDDCDRQFLLEKWFETHGAVS
jgi:hypothetical protein